jgi:hypothetical protein
MIKNNYKNQFRNNDLVEKFEIHKGKNKTISYRNINNKKEKDFIKITKINPITNLQMEIDDYKVDDEIKKVDSTTSIYTLMKREHTYLRANYK